MAGMMKTGGATTRGGIKTLFGDATAPDKDLGGDWGGSKNGDTSFQGAEKGDAGKIPEVTFVDIQGAPKPGASVGEGAGGSVAGKGKGTLRGKE
jgi:hypothetical protein